MGTRANIIICTPKGWARLYNHWDGYPAHLGAVLARFYGVGHARKRLALVENGDVSHIGKEIGEKHDFSERVPHDPETHFSAWCKFYKRDRGDPDCDAELFESLEDAWPCPDSWVEYVYVWDGQKWSVGAKEDSPRALKRLDKVLSGEAEAPFPDVVVPGVGAFKRKANLKAEA